MNRTIRADPLSPKIKDFSKYKPLSPLSRPSEYAVTSSRVNSPNTQRNSSYNVYL